MTWFNFDISVRESFSLESVPHPAYTVMLTWKTIISLATNCTSSSAQYSIRICRLGRSTWAFQWSYLNIKIRNFSGGWSPVGSTLHGGHWLAYCSLPRVIMMENLVEWRLAGETKVLGGKKTTPAPLCPPQIPLEQTQDRTQAATVGIQRLTAWAMARPYETFSGTFNNGFSIKPTRTSGSVAKNSGH
jgi:hypothetical protein